MRNSSESEAQPLFVETFDRQRDTQLVYYRFAKTLGYPIQINDFYKGGSGEIERTVVIMPQGIQKEVFDLCTALWQNTRKGFAVYGATVGMPIRLRKEIVSAQPDIEGNELYNRSEKVPSKALMECFMSSWEELPSTISAYEKNNPELGGYYNYLKGLGLESISLEGMGMLLHDAHDELKRDGRI